MVDPRELRIGNYIYNLSSGSSEFAQVIGIDVEGYLMLQNKEDEYNSFCDEDIHPIPLTEDILMKCGFKRKENFCNRDHFCLYYNHFYIDVFHVNHTIQKYIWNIHIDDESFMNVGYGHFDYVHELQNLFYDLCKTPLDIKL